MKMKILLPLIIGACQGASVAKLRAVDTEKASARNFALDEKPRPTGTSRSIGSYSNESDAMQETHLLPPPWVDGMPYFYEEFSRRDQPVAAVPASDGSFAEIYESMFWFRFRSDVGRSVLVFNGNGQNDKTIGIFTKRWAYPDVEKLRSIAEGIPWSELAEPDGGDIGGAQISIKYSGSSTIVDREFNSYNHAFIASIWPLLGWTQTRQMTLLNEKPLAGLRLSIEARPSPEAPEEYTIAVVFFNPGTHPVLFHDPRRPAIPEGVDARPRLRVSVTPDSDEATPPSERMKIEPPPAGSLQMVTLPGGGRFEVMTRWTSPAPGAYGVVAEWADYELPLAGVAYAPLMPLSADFDETYVEPQDPYLLLGVASTGTMIHIAGTSRP